MSRLTKRVNNYQTMEGGPFADEFNKRTVRTGGDVSVLDIVLEILIDDYDKRHAAKTKEIANAKQM